ncbi:MAG: hypothetical protein QF444_00680 [Phycisphaerales bacterium]|nr:hypothetical protein [Phycisphaerales bacterium]MDP6692814.1 hypothetical protein [Phycisphaerales bacterium]
MRFILEHPWASGCILGSISIALVWTGLRDGKATRIKIGIAMVAFAVAAVFTGTLIDTPREHAHRVVYGFIKAVKQNDARSVRQFVSPSVEFVDDFKGKIKGGAKGVVLGVKNLHEEYPPTSNTILRFEVIERVQDVIVELSMMTRVTHIGSVPNRWRLFISEDEHGLWRITTIDAIEIAFRSYR